MCGESGQMVRKNGGKWEILANFNRFCHGLLGFLDFLIFVQALR